MKPKCPDCGTALSLPTLTEKQLGSIDTESLHFNCPSCEKQLNVKDFIKGGLGGLVNKVLPFGQNADGEESLAEEMNLTDGVSLSDDDLKLDDLGLDDLGIDDEKLDAEILGSTNELGDDLGLLGDSLDLDQPLDETVSAEQVASELGGLNLDTTDSDTPDLAIAEIAGDDADPDLSVVSDELDEVDFVADELPSLDDGDDEVLEFATEEVELVEQVELVDEDVAAASTTPGKETVKDDDDDIDWLSDELDDDDTDLEFDDTLVDSGDVTPDMTAGAKPSTDVGDDEFDFELSDAEDAADAAVGNVDAVADEMAGEFEPADADTVAAAGIFEMRDPPLAASLAEPVAPSGAGHATDEPTAPFGFENEPQPGAYTTAPLPPKKGGLLGTLAKVGIGGLLTLAIAQGAAWWGLGMDPAGLANVAPKFLVPKSLRKQVVKFPPPRVQDNFQSSGGDAMANAGSDSKADGAATMPETDAAVAAVDGTNDPDTAGVEDNKFGAADNGDADNGDADDGDEFGGFEEADDAMASANDEGSQSKPTADAPPEFDSSGLDDLAGGDLDEPDGESMAEESSDASQDDLADLLGAADPPVVESTSPFDGVGPAGFATYSAQDLAGAIPVATKALQRFEEARLTDSPDVNPAAKEFYYAITDVAEQATLVPHADNDDVLAASRDLLRSLNEDQQGRCSAWAHAWLAKDIGKGVVFAADVIGVSKSGELYEMALTLPNKKKTQVVAVTRMNPADNPVMSFDKGSRILLMGLVVEDPSANLPGYSGLESKVVYVTDQIVEGK